MIGDIMSIFKQIRNVIHEVNGFPLSRRIFAYLLLLVAAALFIASSGFCLIMIWTLVKIIFNGNLFDSEPSTDWDIR